MTVCPPEVEQRVIGYLHERFGMDPWLWTPYRFYWSSRGRVYLGPRLLLDNPEPDSAGCLIARIHRSVKPSSVLFQRFGAHVTRASIDLTREQTQRYLAGDSVDVALSQTVDCRPGFVMLRYDEMPLGCGLLREGGLIENQVPRSWWCNVDLL